MHIDVRRTGGIAGGTRTWHVDTDTCDDPSGWSELVGALPGDAPSTLAPAPAVRDDFTWTITVERTTVTIPGTRLDGPWAALVTRVRSEGTPS
ncbi:protealysin inhibitor emfourin [Curtobacterium sp. SP.BCo]|uniref:protealysin inhibitor emfourin n=1 Tax=Curtobacterium sp. SP.BCo TaxID=3435229 RepID=UPI003F73F99F